MILQTLWGHRYPLLDGPSSALLLNILILAPGGMPAIQGGMVAGGIFVLLLGGFRLTRYVEPLFTDNVISVTLILIAITLLPFLAPLIIGQNSSHPYGDSTIFGISVFTMVFIAFLSHWLTGFSGPPRPLLPYGSPPTREAGVGIDPFLRPRKREPGVIRPPASRQRNPTAV